MWSSCDALVLKVLTWIIQKKLKPHLSPCCFHLKGHGGLKSAVKQVMNNYPKYPFFFKTDVTSYYDSIDHYTLIMKLSAYIADAKIIPYVGQFLKRCLEWGGLYQDMTLCISRGSGRRSSNVRRPLPTHGYPSCFPPPYYHGPRYISAGRAAEFAGEISAFEHYYHKIALIKAVGMDPTRYQSSTQES